MFQRSAALPDVERQRGTEHGGKAAYEEKAQTIVGPQDLPGRVKAAWPHAQCQAGPMETRRKTPDTGASHASERAEIARILGGRAGGNEPSARNDKAPSPMLSYAVRTARECLRGESSQVTEPQEESADGQAVHPGREAYKTPTGEVRQVSHGKDATVRARRTAETLLHMLQDRGTRQLPLDDVDRQLYNPAMSLRSYARL
jgi:hypothetical protein